VQETLQTFVQARGGAVSRLEIMEGPTGRRAWHKDVKARIVAETLVPGARVVDVARRYGITPQSLTDWRQRAKTRGVSRPDAEAGSFVPLVVGRDREATSGVHIEMEVGGVVVRLPAEFPSSRIGDIARALRRP
jgi:transposase